jgi:uncharacterized protein
VTTAPATPTATRNWAAVPTPALYDVEIGHARPRPARRRFTHRGFLWLVDLDDIAVGRLAQGRRLPRWLRAQARFEPADHFGDPARSIKENVVAFAREQGVEGVARVLMLAHPRTGLGRHISYVFNPLSTHWCYRADGSLACIVAEVHNTYGGRHGYLLRPDERGRAETGKQFYVSPFLQVAGRYRMRFSPPGPRLDIGIALHQEGEVAFTAWLRGTARPATARTIAAATFHRPLMALRVSALIRWHGIALWMHRLPVVPLHPIRERRRGTAGQEWAASAQHRETARRNTA